MTTLPKAVKDWTAEDFASAFDEYNALDRANGELMAAAPDLLQALKGLLFNHQHGNGANAWQESRERAQTAINKATGEG